MNGKRKVAFSPARNIRLVSNLADSKFARVVSDFNRE